MEVLPDIVAPDPVVVFCGLAGAESTKHREHYYASPGNSFWESLHLSGFSPRRLRPYEGVEVVRLGRSGRTTGTSVRPRFSCSPAPAGPISARTTTDDPPGWPGGTTSRPSAGSRHTGDPDRSRRPIVPLTCTNAASVIQIASISPIHLRHPRPGRTVATTSSSYNDVVIHI